MKPPKGAAGLGDSALDFIVDVGLTGQGVSQVCEFVHIIEHFTIYCDVRFHMGLARAQLVHDFGFIVTDGEAEVVTCPRKPVSTSFNCLFTDGIESTVVSEKKVFDDRLFHLSYC